MAGVLRRLGRDVRAAAVLFAASLFFLVHLLTTPAPGAGFVSTTTLPTAVAAAMVLLALLQLATALAGRTGRIPGEAVPPATAATADRHGPWRVAALIAWTVLDIALMPWLGYLLTTAIYVGGLALLFGSRRPLAILALVVLVPVLLLLFFERFMLVLLPSARLFE